MPGAAAPTLRFFIGLDAGARALRGATLNVRLHIKAERRRYADDESERLRELFGAPEQWSLSLGSVPWTRGTLSVGPFHGTTTVALDVPCTYDFEVAAAKYLAALEDGLVPLELLFSGTVLWTTADGRLQTAMIPWDREASFRLPLEVWSRALRASFGDSAWLRVHRDVFARLQTFRAERGLTTWEDTLEALLSQAQRSDEASWPEEPR